MTNQKKQTTPIVTVDNHPIYEKKEIERMKKLLSEKIKDPKLAKKAAMLITEMLNQKK